MNLKLSRNFPIGRSHLTKDGKTTLCSVPLTNEAYPPKPITDETLEDTCRLCNKVAIKKGYFDVG